MINHKDIDANIRNVLIFFVLNEIQNNFFSNQILDILLFHGILFQLVNDKPIDIALKKYRSVIVQLLKSKTTNKPS